MQFQWLEWRGMLWSLAGIGAALLVASVVHFVLFRVAQRLTLHKRGVLADSVLHCETPVRWILLLLIEMAAVPFLPLSNTVRGVLRHGLGLALIAATAWLIIAMIDVLQSVLSDRYPLEMADNLVARRVYTHVQVLRRTATDIITLLPIALMFMPFPSVLHLVESPF